MSATSEPSAAAACDAAAPSPPQAPPGLSAGRLLFARPGTDKPAEPDARALARRDHLHAHARRARARREALLALLGSSALGEMVRIDAQLQHDLSRLMAFVLGDTAPPP